MLRALARRRSLVAVTVVAVALAAFAVPVLASFDGHCAGGADPHCQPGLVQAPELPGAGDRGLLDSPGLSLSTPGIIRLVFKIPLDA